MTKVIQMMNIFKINAKNDDPNIGSHEPGCELRGLNYVTV